MLASPHQKALALWVFCRVGLVFRAYFLTCPNFCASFLLVIRYHLPPSCLPTILLGLQPGYQRDHGDGERRGRREGEKINLCWVCSVWPLVQCQPRWMYVPSTRDENNKGRSKGRAHKDTMNMGRRESKSWTSTSASRASIYCSLAHHKGRCQV